MLSSLLADGSLFLLAVLLASAAMVRLAGRMPWSAQAVALRFPCYFGIALAPFLYGFIGVLLLGLLPGAAADTHLGLLFGGLAALNLLLWRPRPGLPAPTPAPAGDRWTVLAVLLLGLVVLCLFFNTLAFPLTQNDPLEYATVARALYEARDLTLYPLVGPSTGGFYGPWTHPPLYVAAIYNSYLLQGHAEMPGLARFIAPWCAVGAGGLVYALGSFAGRRAGLYALLLFASPPLFFLGIESSSIDVLPVLGFLLVVVALAGLRGRIVPMAAWAGLALGIALWTHSQGLLFVPLAAVVLVLIYGLSAWRRLLPYYAIMLLVAGVVAAWPYWNNVEIFGAIISDNPEVFALPVLDWPSYFRFNRGIVGPTSIAQYGVLKGWFAYDAYGFVFWLVTLALGAYAVHLFRTRRFVRGLSSGQPEPDEMLLWCAAGVTVAYLAGVVLSVLLGIDLMIRNERYMLVILPFVALLGGWYIDRLLAPGGAWRWLHVLLVLGVLAAMLLQLFVFVVLRLELNRMSLSALQQPHAAKLLHRAEYRTIDYLRHTPTDAVVLALKPADMYYARRRMVSYLDPVMLDFYRSTDVHEGLARLKALGITHVQVPDYSLPPFYNSLLQEILADPALSRLEFSAAGNQIYALQPSGQRIAGEVDLLTYGSWSYVNQLEMGRKGIKRLTLADGVADIAGPSVVALPFGLFQRDISRSLVTGRDGVTGTYLPVGGHRCYVARFALVGAGYVELRLTYYDAAGGIFKNPDDRAVQHQLMGSTALSGSDRVQLLAKRFCVPEHAASMRLALKQYGNGSLKIEKAVLQTLTDQKAAP